MNNNKNNNGTLAMVALAAGALTAGGIFLYQKLFSQEEEQHQAHTNAHRHRYNSSSRTVPLKPSNECCICLEMLSPPMEQLPCDHLFHADCLMKCLVEIDFKKCPICRAHLNDNQIKLYMDRYNKS